MVSLSMLGVSTDSDAALALGYGTIDIPLLDEIAEVLAIYAAYSKRGAERNEQTLLNALAALAVIESRIPYDYMVTAPYVLPFGITLTLAALSQPAIPVEQVENFSASILSTHAVMTRDTGAEVAVELTWNPATQPQATGLLVSRQAGQSQYLNTPRPATVHGYDPYLGLPPTQPPPNPSPSDLLPNLKDANGTVPLNGSTTTRYLAAGIDVVRALVRVDGGGHLTCGCCGDGSGTRQDFVGFPRSCRSAHIRNTSAVLVANRSVVELGGSLTGIDCDLWQFCSAGHQSGAHGLPQCAGDE